MSMTEVFDAVMPVVVPADDRPATSAPKTGRVDETVELPTVSKPSVLSRAGSTVKADLRGAWLWDTRGPSPRSLWQTRIPAIEQVPGENAALRSAWIAYNHVALLILPPLMVAFWVACHPARLLYALPIATPIVALWLL